MTPPAAGPQDGAGVPQHRLSVLVALPAHSPLSAAPLHYVYHTSLPAGTLVRVPLGQRRVLGVVWDEGPHAAPAPADVEPRSIVEAFDELPALDASWRELVAFVARYYQRSLGEVALAALPPQLRDLDRTQLMRRLKKQARHTRQAGPQDAGMAETIAPSPPETSVVLTPQQEAAVAAIDAAARLQPAPPMLLFGCTGSGKTEVYMRAVEQVLSRDPLAQVLVLVPEINLTPQLEARFRARFPATALCCLHSQIAEGQRAKAWVAAWQGQTQLVIGTRLAVFTPLPNLGLIVVDEEHDSSFKQQEGLRYSARDLAVWRGREMGVPVVLGSATPSLESLAAAVTGRYRKVQLTTRATAAPMPTIHLVDIRRQVLRDGLSPAALAALSEGLAAQETSLVFINRRGWSPVVACTDCGWMAACPHCAARLVLHQARRRLQCHHCGHQAAIPHACPSCGNPDLKPLGEGTQRIESTLKRQFPTARIVRIDRDSVSRRSTWETVYQQVMAGEVDILIGTQMMAKGHDFPSLSRVVALNSDGALYSPDFRAEERLFALLSQVAGRAGRAGIAGQVWLQTQFPDHPLYLALSQHDTSGFMARLLETRTAEGYPPAVFQALVRADAPDDEAAMVFLRQVVAWLGTHHANPEVMVLGPAPAMLARLAGRSRAQILLQADQRPPLHGCLAALTTAAPTLAKPFGKDLRWSVDVDPLDW